MKNKVIIITLVFVAGFLGLVYYAIMHSRGIPVKIEKIETPVLAVPFIDTRIDLSKDISLNTWDTLSGKEIKLMYQVMVLPWPKAVVPSVLVKAFRTQEDIYFYVSWKDDTEDRTHAMNQFSDACAIMFPLGKEAQPSSIMMGFIGKTNIWHWKASQDNEYWQGAHPKTDAYADFYYPFEEKELFVVSKQTPQSAVSDLLAIRVGTVTSKEANAIQGRGFWKDGAWNVVFKRPLKAENIEEDTGFELGKKRLCAFAAWNGSKGDRGGRKSISDWVELDIK